MDALKICITVDGKTRIFYTDIVSNYKTLLNKCEDEYRNVETMYKYWIDDDGDKVEINGEQSYKMFLKLSPKKRIYIENDGIVEEITPTTSDIKKEKPLKSDINGNKLRDSIHSGVSCDKCNMLPIIGFRYKCLECPDFDLCMICEGKRHHRNHKMIRIPTQHDRRRNSNISICNTNVNSTGYADPFNDFAVNIDVPIKSADSTERERRRKHQKRSRSDRSSMIQEMGANVLTNLYQMMQGMADNSSPNATNNINTSPKTQVTNKNDEKKSDNADELKKNENKSTPPTTPPPQKESQQNQQQSNQNSNQKQQYDFETIKVGAEILNKMFGKFLDPINVCVEPHVFVNGVPTTQVPTNTTNDSGTTNVTTKTTTDTEEKKISELTASTSNSTVNTNTIDSNFTTNITDSTKVKMEPLHAATNTVTVSSTNNSNFEKNQNNLQASAEIVLIEDVPEIQANCNNWQSTDGAIGGLIHTEIVPVVEEYPTEKSSIGSNKSQDDNGWTFIDNEKLICNKSRSSSCQSTSDLIKPTAPNESPQTTELNYFQLSKSLEKHIKEEEQRKNQSLVSDVVFHEKPHINNAIIAMVAMGFSNEGKWLTHLLESVDGDISKALDLLQPAK